MIPSLAYATDVPAGQVVHVKRPHVVVDEGTAGAVPTQDYPLYL